MESRQHKEKSPTCEMTDRHSAKKCNANHKFARCSASSTSTPSALLRRTRRAGTELEQLGLIDDAPEAGAGEGTSPILVQEVCDRRQPRGLPAHRLSELSSAGADGQRLLCTPLQVSDAGGAADSDPHPPGPWCDTAVLEKRGNALGLTKDCQAVPAPVRAPQKPFPHCSPPPLDEQAGQHRGEPGNGGTATLEADDTPLMAATGSGHRPPLRRREA